MTQTANLPSATPTSRELSTALSALLDDPGSPEAAARRISENPALLEEARDALPALRAVAIAKSGPEGVSKIIARRFSIYPQPQRSESEWADWWRDYFDVLAEVGLAQLEAAMRAYVSAPESEFMPKPGKLLELSKVTPCRSIQRYHRAKRAATMAIEAQPAGERADPAEVKRLLADFQAGSVAKSASDRPMPYIGGIPDERGITPQMREVMQRRSA